MTSEIFEAKKRLLEKLGWRENPFIKDLRVSNREEFMKYYCPFEADSILKRLAFDAKACMLLGPKGVGKTSALYFVAFSLPQKEFEFVVFKEPPESLEGLARDANLDAEGVFQAISGLFGGKKHPMSRQKIAEKLRAKGKKMVFFVDEAHLAKNPDIYMEFKYLLDEVPNLRLVISALGKDNFPDSLVQLVGEANVFVRKHFSEEEMRRIVEHRIKAVGGLGIKPFSEAVLRHVFSEQNLLTPRYVFDELNNYLAILATEGEKAAEGEEKAHHAKKQEKPAKEDEAEEAYEEEKVAEELAESAKEIEREKPKPEYYKRYEHDSLIRGVIDRELVDQEKKRGAKGASEHAEKRDKITTMHADWWTLLSPSQQSVITSLIQSDGLTLSELLKATGLSQNTAFNALYQLRGDDEAELKRKPEVPFPLVIVKHKLVGGRKKNLYYVNPKVKNLFTLH